MPKRVGVWYFHEFLFIIWIYFILSSAFFWIMYWITHYLLLTYSMEQSPSWEANWFAASQEIPRILWNPKFHYRTHKFPPPVPILSQPNPVHIPTSHLLEIHPNIIHSSTPRSPQRSLSFRFPHQELIRPPLLTHTRHMPSLSHSSRFYHPHNIGWGVQIIQLLVMQSISFYKKNGFSPWNNSVLSLC